MIESINENSVNIELKSICEKINRKQALKEEIYTINCEREKKEASEFEKSEKRLLRFQKTNQLSKGYPIISIPKDIFEKTPHSSTSITTTRLRLAIIESCAFIISLIWFASIFVKSEITGEFPFLIFMLSLAVTSILGLYFFVGSLDYIKGAIEFSISCEEYEHQKKELEDKVSKIDRLSLETQWDRFDRAFLAFVHKCNNEYNREADAFDTKIKEFEEDALCRIKAINEEIRVIDEELEKVTLIHSSLFEYAGKIGEILSIGRADSLKEAINIALEDVRKDNEEKARKEEAERQEEILREQARAQELHNLEMQRKYEEAERNARIEAAENRRMFEAFECRAQRDAAEMRRQQESYQRDMKRMAEKEAQSRKNALVGRCLSCANSGRCSSSIRGKLENCPSFVPRH